MLYDYLIVGTGICGSVLAERLDKSGASVLMVEKRGCVGGNMRCEEIEGITVHRYGAHIFRTSNPEVWSYVNRFVTFNRFTNSPIANYNGELYNLPFNMNTFYQLFGVITPEDARAAIEHDRVPCAEPKNLEQHVLNTVGKTIYEKLVKGYTEKQWGRKCTELPPETMRRIPVRFTFDNNYFNEKWQGIPNEGYNTLFDRMLRGIPVELNVDYIADRERLDKMARYVIYTGQLDALYGYSRGRLDYRTLRFEDVIINKNNSQGVAVMNYTDATTPFTRSIEHKHFVFGDDRDKTVVTYEYSDEWHDGAEPYYPIENERNLYLYGQYRHMAKNDGIITCGRLAEYKYYDMQDTIASALNLSKRLCRSWK